MPIDYTDPAQTTHQGEPIPIDTPTKYAMGEAILERLYTLHDVPWTQDSADRYEQRVRNGQTMREIVSNTYDEYLERSAS